MSPRLSVDAREEVRLRMAGLSGAEARAAARELAVAYGVTECTVYRASNRQRSAKARTSRGERKVIVSNEVLEKMFAYTYQTDSPATDVIEIFEGNGLLEPGQISAAWFTRWLKSQGLSRKEQKEDRRPYRRFEAREPGEVYQLDATTALQWYIDDDGSVAWESVVSANKNRAGNRKARLVLLAAIDDHSRCVWAEFTTGQTTCHWLNFEFNTFRKKPDPRFRFCGIPKKIYMDNDSVAKTTKFARAHATLGIKITKHKATKKSDRFSNARSKGKIERFLRTLSEKQKRTKVCKFASLAQAKQFLYEVCLWYNTRKHSETGEAPFARWSRIRPEMLVQCEDDRLYELLYRDEYQCRVNNNLTLRLDGKWQLPWENPFFNMIGRTVTVFRHPLEPERIAVEWEGHEYLVERNEAEIRDWASGPVRQPKTALQQRLAAAENEDFSELKLFGFDRGRDQEVAYLPMRDGTPLNVPASVAASPRIRQVDALLRVARELGCQQVPPDALYLKAVWGEWVTEEEIDTALAELRAPTGLRAPAEVKAG